MKQFAVTMGLVLLAGAVASGLVLALSLEPAEQSSALLAVLVSTLAGVFSVAFKRRTADQDAVAVLLKAQGLGFGVKLAAVAAGLVALKRTGGAPVPFVVVFLAMYVVQQLIETRFVLASRRARTAGVRQA